MQETTMLRIVPVLMPSDIRLQNAKDFLVDCPTESVIVAARINNVVPATLYSSISRAKVPPKKVGGQNKILQDEQAEAIHAFIRNLLACDVQPTPSIVYNAIVALKKSQYPNRNAPSRGWFTGWYRDHNLHKIKTKPLASVRYTCAEESDIKVWFDDYWRVLAERNITKRQNVINFDEGGFRVGCMKGHQIIVPNDVREYYSMSPENRKSLTIFECVNAAGGPPPPPLIVIQGSELMQDWYAPGLPAGTLIIPSPNGFTSNEIAIEYLRHYIKHSDAGPNSDWKIMIMDNHGSHCTPEFVILANENHIRPYPLIPHFTHCMQPLDVGIFQPYKHYHDLAIQQALSEFNLEYTMRRFLDDLGDIREKTFKPKTVQSAFTKAGMWPPSAAKCIQQMKTFAPKKKAKIEEPLLPDMPRVWPATPAQVDRGLGEWDEKIQAGMLWSDPVREEEWRQFRKKTNDICTRAELDATSLKLYEIRRLDEITHTTSRKRLKKLGAGLGLTKEDAMEQILAKERAERAEEARLVHKNIMDHWRGEKDLKWREGVEARKMEKARKKSIKGHLMYKAPFPFGLTEPIPDPWPLWIVDNPLWDGYQQASRDRKAAAQRKRRAESVDLDAQPDDVMFITDFGGDPTLHARNLEMGFSDFDKGFSDLDNEGEHSEGSDSV